MEGQEDDPLIPTQESMNSTWDLAEATWQSYVAKSTGWPTGFFDPFMLLSAIPQLPRVIPRTTLWGRPIWEVPDSAGNPTSVDGRRAEFVLSQHAPPIISYQTHHNIQEVPASMTLVTLCWSYILSVNLLERQGAKAIYTTNHVRPVSIASGLDDADTVDLQLPAEASDGLIAWVCALVTPKMGWVAEDRNDYPIWAIGCPESPRVRVSITNAPRLDQHSFRPDSERRPGPTFDEAVQLFSELCRLCGLDKDISPASIPAIEASLMAILALPYFYLTGAQVVLPRPYLVSRSTKIDFEEPIAPYVHDSIAEYCKHLGYFMTLSSHKTLYRSMLWTVFWQPGISCNLVSSWFGGIQSILRPMLDEKDFGKLLRTLAARRPRVALMWLGVFLFGGGGSQQRLFDNFDCHLQGSQASGYHGLYFEKSTFEMGPWTGSVQSFWDYELDEAGYYRKNVQEPLTAPGFHNRSEMMQRRYNANLLKRGPYPGAWEPLSRPISAAEIEPELDMSGELFRRYLFFVCPQSNTMNRGFAYYHGVHRQIFAPPDDFELVHPHPAKARSQEGPGDESVKATTTRRDRRRTFLGPSKRATADYIRVVALGVSGKTNYDAVKDFQNHPWAPVGLGDWLEWCDKKGGPWIERRA